MTPPPPSAALSGCAFHGDHARVRSELDHLAREIDRIDRERRANESKLFDRMDAFAQRLSALEARVAAYVALGSLLTVILSFIAKKVFGVG